MKTLFAIVMFLSLNAQAHDEPGNVSGIYYDPTRSGEGIFVVHDQEFYGEEMLAFALFTYDPAATIEEENCETVPAVYADEELIQESYEVCVTASVEVGNQPVWYTAADPWDGDSFGVLYRSEAINYPVSYFGEISDEDAVGLYILDKTETGMRLLVTEFEDMAPGTLYKAYFFDQKLLGSQ